MLWFSNLVDNVCSRKHIHRPDGGLFYTSNNYVRKIAYVIINARFYLRRKVVIQAGKIAENN